MEYIGRHGSLDQRGRGTWELACFRTQGYTRVFEHPAFPLPPADLQIKDKYSQIGTERTNRITSLAPFCKTSDAMHIIKYLGDHDEYLQEKVDLA